MGMINMKQVLAINFLRVSSLMNSDIAFEISKYLDRRTGIPSLDCAYESSEVLRQGKENAWTYLNKKLGSRPSKIELEGRNIIRCEVIDFDYVHTVLRSISFKESNSKVSPRIANMASKIDFSLKRKMIIQKLGLSHLERQFR